MKIKSSYIKSALPFLLLSLTVLLQYIFKNNPSFTEKIYSTGIYPVLAKVLSSISQSIPFSLDDVFYVSLVATFLIGLGRCIFKRLKLLRYLLKIFQVLAIVYISFYWLWGFNYYRESAHERLDLSKSETNDSTFVQMFNEIIEHTNKSYTHTSNFRESKNDSVLEATYQNMSHFLKIESAMCKSRIKHITFSDFFAKATILGYYGPFFNETHINKHLTSWDIPVVSAHEKSHQLGVTSEAEAGFYGWLITVNSEDAFTQYSGWLYALDYFIYQSRGLDNRKDLFKKIRSEVIDDMKKRNKHWRSWRNEKIDKATSKVNDVYLKSNNIKKGIDDYNGVVQLIIDYLQQHN